MEKILLVFTGGTIGTVSSDNVRRLAPDTARRLVVDNFARGNSPFAPLAYEIFEEAQPINILSENMDKPTLNSLVSFFKGVDFKSYKGVIVLHGTDTLAYSCAFVSLLLGADCLPVLFVSSNAPLNNPTSNGDENFARAVECILNGEVKCGVYAVYKNISDNKMRLYKGDEIMQSPSFTDDFYSVELFCKPHRPLIKKIDSITADILCINPYVGINYDAYDVTKFGAVLHTTYHSGTLESNSFKSFVNRCAKNGVLVYVWVCRRGEEEIYSSTASINSENVVFLKDMTAETAYCKLLLAYSLYSGDDAVDFMLNS